MSKFVIILILSLINLKYINCCSGCLDLDVLTFDKVLTKFKSALVKFDQYFPYGDNHEAFAAFSEEINNKSLSGTGHEDIIIATVGIKDYGDYDNQKLADRYGVKATELPVIKLFNDGNLDQPIDFVKGTDKITSTTLFAFLKQNSLAYIKAPGCSKELDELSKQFMEEPSKRNEILKNAEGSIEKIKCEKKKHVAKFYAALMKGVIEKGEDFIVKQQDRLNKLLKDKISENKIKEINKKLNIIVSFKKFLKPSEKVEL